MSFELFNKLKEDIINIDENLYEDLEEDYNEIVDIDNTSIHNLNFFSKGMFLRDINEEDIIELFYKAYEEDEKKALKILFFIRDKEKGLGERKVFRICLNFLGNIDSYILKENLSLIPHYGRWDDLYSLFDTKLENETIKLIKDTLNKDLNSLTPSTLAKWLKSENTSSPESRRLAKKTRLLLNMSSKEYRTTLSKLRKKLNIVESSMSKGNWESIQYGNITFKSINKYKNAFLKHDYSRYKEYRELYKQFLECRGGGLKESLIDENFPYMFVEDFIRNGHASPLYDYKSYIKEYKGDTIVSLGLSSKNFINNKNINTLYGGVGTILYFLRENRGRYKKHIITMKPKPNFKKIDMDNIKDKIEEIVKSSVCNEINVEAALDLILFAAIKHGINEEHIPKRLLFVIDPGCKISMLSRGNNKETPYFINAEEFERIKEKWNCANLNIPHLIFWNIDKRRESSTIIKYSDNFTYAFGYSNEVFISLLNDESNSTQDLLNKVLEDNRYKAVI
ncbi:DUF2828 family protein [Clostridium paraputrificum]|uniref:DUF2828 family protein n=1 Tax=Clostridium paraputrificum TaxID=29363 RepID=UPI002FCD94C5